ncbi:hypothetical protein SMSP2_00227 [Limihaloglobus sulfuriphilus]|uniref:Carbohydrate binding domain protein n=1 Tax=Limihaloglobus sulfuriphilus TaxID=1851148 RepID=A0A1Q2MAZ1_9BACT|nr:hypothetical protein [Limihaloglobus sulfuriphilus]AQQ69893.1 hypothetical protein SMSP2_00227 [Limihaloglobus sulfuriphilus]
MKKMLLAIMLGVMVLCSYAVTYDTTNLVTNGDAETGTFSGWYHAASPFATVTDTDSAGDGAYSFMLDTTGSDSNANLRMVPLEAGPEEPYLLKFKYKTLPGAILPNDNSFVMLFRSYESIDGGNTVNWQGQTGMNLAATDGEWVSVELEVVTEASPTGAIDIMFALNTFDEGYANGIALVDDVELYRGSTTVYEETNILKNGDAESTVDFQYWFKAAAPLAVINRTDSATYGTSSFELDNTTNGYAQPDLRSQPISAESEEKFYLKFYYKTTDVYDFYGEVPDTGAFAVWFRSFASDNTFLGQFYMPLEPTDNEWALIETEVAAQPAQDGKEVDYCDVRFVLNNVNPVDGIVRIDEIELYREKGDVLVYDKSNNLLTNGEAEKGTSDNWHLFNNATVVETPVQAGSYAFQADTTGVTEMTHNSFTVNPDEKLLLECWLNSTDTMTASSVKLRFFNTSVDPQVFLGEEWIGFDNTGGEWVLYSNEYTVPAEATVADVYIRIDSPSLSYVDTVGVYRQISQLGPFEPADILSMSSAWLSNDLQPLLSDVETDDFESYASQGDMEVWWGLTSGSYPSRGTSTITLLTNPADAYEGNNALRWEYDNSGVETESWTEFNRILANPVDLSQYNEMRIWVNRHIGNSQERLLYLKFYQESIVESNILAEAQLDVSQGSTFEPIGWNQIVIPLNNEDLIFTRGASSMEDLSNVVGFFFGVVGDENTGKGSGTIDIDDISFVNTDPNCGGNPPAWDLDGNCAVDFGDFAIMAANWLAAQ